MKTDCLNFFSLVLLGYRALNFGNVVEVSPFVLEDVLPSHAIGLLSNTNRFFQIGNLFLEGSLNERSPSREIEF